MRANAPRRNFHLRQTGCEIRDTNWRAGQDRLDIVALRGEMRISWRSRPVEPGRSRRESGRHADASSARPARAAARYLRTAGWQGGVQFDLAAVTLSDDSRADMELIERAMEHHW